MIVLLPVLMLLAACGGSSGGGATGGGSTTTITGSGGDGPISGGAISVTDGNGAVVATTPASPVTDATAHYSFTIPSTTPLPLTVTLTNGTDTVTTAPQDFDLTGVETAALPAAGTLILNLNPLSTLAVASAKAKGALTAANLTAAVTDVLDTVNFGLPAGFDPETTKVDTANVAAVVKANEAAAELIRRTGASATKTMADTITAIAEDITDGVLDGKVATGVTATQVTAKTAGVILTKQAEIAAAMLAGQLKITDKTGATKVTAANMKSKLNASILVTQPAATGAAADVSQVVVPQKFIDQAINAVSQANFLAGGNATLNNLEAAIHALSADAVLGTTQAADILTASNNAGTALTTADTNANAGTNTATVSTAATKTNAAPVFTGTPAISGTAAVGNRLSLTGTATSDTDTGNTLTLTYQWNANGAVIAGATSATYTVQAGDAGKQITAVITVNDGQSAANSATSVVTASVAIPPDTTAPTNQNTVLTTSTTVAGGGSVAIASSGTAGNNVWLAPAGTTVFTAGPTMTKAASGTATSITAPATGGAYKLFVIDAAGNVSTASTATVTVDTTPPVLSSFTSTTADGSFKAAATINITATYDEAPAAGSTLTVSLDSGKTGLILNTISGNTITGAYAVSAGENSADLTVSAITSQSVSDAAGNTLSATTVPSTNIAAGSAIVVDTTAPTITSKIPAASATGVALDAGVNITFSEPMDTTTITTTSFTLTAGSNITGVITHNGGNIETFTPSANLAPNTLHTVVVTNAITDVAGNALTATNWTFTTAVQTFTVGGSVSGLAAGESVVLQDNGGDDLTVSNPNTTFIFATKVADAAAYSVTVLTQPTGKTCTVSNGSGTISGAAVSNVSVVCPIAVPLNDTGIDTWGDASANNLTVTQSAFPSQDADNGRDAQAKANTLTKVGASTNNTTQGFDFTKLDSTGTALTDQTVAYTTTPWDCVQDNHTGLMWEVKTTDGTIRDKTSTFTWYNSNTATNGGNAGTAGGGACTGGTGCDTEKYVADVNALTGASRICGFTDWRLPTKDELLSIVDNSVAAFGTAIDTGYFPNTVVGGVYWSASPSVGNASDAWGVNFGIGDGNVNGKSHGNDVRLVRGGQ